MTKKFEIKSMIPATGWRAWQCRFKDDQPQIEELLVPCLAVVRYTRDESDSIEPVIVFENITLPERKLRDVFHSELRSGLGITAPNQVFDDEFREWLVVDTQSTLEAMAKQTS